MVVILFATLNFLAIHFPTARPVFLGKRVNVFFVISGFILIDMTRKKAGHLFCLLAS